MNKALPAIHRRLSIVLLALAALGGVSCVINKPSPALSTAHRVFDPNYNDWNYILAHYVTPAGVDYARMKRERATARLGIALEEMLQVTPNQFDGWVREAKLALLINAHNAHAMMRVLNHYPVKSLGRTAGLLGSARGARNIRLLGRNWSLAALADEITGYAYHESRGVFLLNWAARGCAPLPGVAITAQNIEDLMERQTRAFMADPRNQQYDLKKHVLRVSTLLKWYRDPIQRDFQTPWDFIRRYLPREEVTPIEQRNQGPRIRYLSFDKRLNDTVLKQGN